MKKLTIYVSFTPEQMDFITEKMKNRTSKQEYLGFWGSVEPSKKEKISSHIASTVNYFLDTNREEIYFGCDQTDLDVVLSQIKTEAFEITIIHSEKFEVDIDMDFNGYWLKKESEHYIFNYKKSSFAELHINEIICTQEQCYHEITSLLKTFPDKKINYWLCDSRKEVSKLSGSGENNGVTHCQNGVATIYCVYNETVQCIGFHEDTHAIAFYYSDIKCDALAEGLAMYMDKKWWGLDNELCTKVYLETDNYIPLEEMIFGSFYEIKAEISYPIMGAFVKMLVDSCGVEKFKELYVYEDDNWPGAFYNIYKVTFADAEKKFIEHIQSLNYTENQMRSAYITLFEN